ncbi:MAG TPA: hypothetical protein VE028_09985 [Nitratidesulfovibrio sp.]|nr:hypothetical protein [Nitratidesulfovibrio sp.]
MRTHDFTPDPNDRLIYDPTPNRKKHRWDKNTAGFLDYHGTMTGRCPNDIELQEAQKLLNDAIADPPSEFDDEYPKRLYNVREGVIYCAQGGGRSNKYHAFPCDNIDSLADETLEELERRAIATNHLKVFKNWKGKYGSSRHR